MNYQAINTITQCRRSGRCIDEHGAYLHANGMRPIEVQRLVEALATIGYDIMQPFAPLTVWNLGH